MEPVARGRVGNGQATTPGALVRSALALASLAILATPPASGQAASPIADRAAVLADLLQARSAPSDWRRHEAERELSRLGPEMLEPVLDLLFREAALQDARGAACPLDAATEEVLQELLRRWPEERVAGALEERGRGSLGRTLRALEVLASAGGATGIATALDLLEGIEPHEAVHPLVEGRLTVAVAEMAARAPEALEVLGPRLERADEGPLVAVAAALGRIGRGECRRLLADLRGRSPELDEAVLRALGDWKRWDAEADACEELVADRLADSSPALRRAAARAAGRLRDWNAVPALLDLLGDADRGVRRAAAEGLRAIGGPRDTGAADVAGAWEAWHAAEVLWLQERVDPLLEQARAEAPDRALVALQELGAHPWFGDQLALEVAPLLRDERLVVAQAACEVLLAFGTSDAVLELAGALADPRPELRAVALAALRAATGADLPADRGPWAELLED